MSFKRAAKISDDAEEVKKEHRKHLKTLVDDYMGRMESGKVEGIRTTRELVEVIKMDLLLLGEATERNEEISTTEQVKIDSISKVIDENDPMVQSIMAELFQELNSANDSQGVSSGTQKQEYQADTVEEALDDGGPMEEVAELIPEQGGNDYEDECE